jgi:predicted  nucleic acid-binding Zn-ribbon protein
MSDFSSGNEVISSSEGEVTIEKSFDGEEFAVPAIRFELQSGHDDAVTVRLTDRIPDDFPMDNVGFHPEYENENWTAYKDHRVQFERTLEPNESLTTVYGIRLSDWSDAEKFLIEPELEEVTPVTGDAEGQGEERMEEHTITDIVSEDSSQVVRDVITGDSGLPGLDDESEPSDEASDPLADAGSDPLGDPLASTADADETDPLSDTASTDVASADVADDSTEAEPESEADFDESPLDDSDDLDNVTDGPFDETMDEPDAVAGGSVESDDIIEAPDEPMDEPPVSPPRPGSVAAALADEIRAGEVNGDDLKLIQQELDLDTPESTNVRIRHLQSRVDDLGAYTEALEEFIDDNGTAKTLIDGFETEVEAVRAEIDAMDTEIESAKDEGAQARARVADLETTIDSLETGLESDIEALEDDLDELGDLDSNLDGLESQLDDLEDLVATNTQEASALDDELEDLRDDFETVDSIGGKIESLSDDVSELSDSVAATETRMDEKVETLRADIENIESELKELNEWRNQLGSVFGGN